LVADFGIALALSAASPRATKPGLALGTPQYMSPEQATGDGTIDARADVYALGTVVYEMLAGEAPYTGTSGTAIIAKRSAMPAPLLRILRPAVPVVIEAAVARALAREPVDGTPPLATPRR
jgi:serine/threonine-protein kinase